MKKKYKVIIGFIIVIVLINVIYQLFFYYNTEMLEIYKTSMDASKDKLELHVKSHLKRQHPYDVWFVSDLNLDELLQEVKKEGWDITYKPEEELIRIIWNNGAVHIVQEEKRKSVWGTRYHYHMRTEMISMEVGGIQDNPYVAIPFYSEFVDVEGMYETNMKLNCSMEDLKEYYQYFTNAVISEDRIILTLEEYEVEMIVKDGYITILVK